MLKRVLVGIIGLLVLFASYVAMQPSSFRVERSTIVVAPQANVFAEVNNFHNWQAWSPWAKMDPNAKATFEGPEQGQGAVFHWAGNEKVGEGSMTIVDSKPDERVHIRLDFLKPWKATNNVEFAFKGDGPRTLVTWSMSGEQGFIEKAICVFMNMDKMVGADFERGLANLKTVAEGKAAPATPDGT